MDTQQVFQSSDHDLHRVCIHFLVVKVGENFPLTRDQFHVVRQLLFHLLQPFQQFSPFHDALAGTFPSFEITK